MRSILNKLGYILTKKQKMSFFFVTGLMIISSFLEMVSIGFLIPVVSLIVDGNIENSYLNLNILTSATENFSKQNLLFFIFSSFLLIFLIKLLFTLYFLYKKNVLIFNVRNYLSKKIFKSFLNRPYDFHQSNNTSKLAINCKYEIELFTSNVLLGGIELLTDIALVVSLIILLMFLEMKLTLLISLIFLLFIYLYQLVLRKRIKIWAEERQDYDSLLNKVIQEGLGSIKEIILSFKENFFIKKLVQYLKLSSMVSIRAQMAFDVPRPLMEFIAIIGFVLIFFILTFFGYETERVLTLIGIFAAVSFKLLPCFNRIMANMQKYKFGTPVIEFIDNELRSTNLLDQELDLQKKTKIKKIFLNSNIKIKELNFSYVDKLSKKVIFKNCNLKINKGEYIGMVGPSGTGKSTFLNIISGLIKNYDGQVLIDDKDIKSLNKTWTNRVAYISQNPFFLDDTIKSNIAFAEDEEDINESKIWEALKSAQLYELVKSSKEELNTVIGEKGTRLSAGQLQRLAIARALYDDFDLIILDESLNALDGENERKILDVLKKLESKEKTILLISHHLTNLKDCKKIIEIKDKNILEKK